MAAKDSNNTNQYSIHENVIVSLIRKTMEGFPGIIRLAGNTFVSDLADLVGSSKRILDHSIIVFFDEKQNLSLEISVVAEYGINFTETARNLQKMIYQQITEFVGVEIAKIDIVITDVEFVENNGNDEEDDDDNETENMITGEGEE